MVMTLLPRDESRRCRPPSSTSRTPPGGRSCNGSGARPVLATRSSTWFFSSTSDVSYLPCRDERSCAPVRTDATAAATTEPTEASNDGSRRRGHFGLPAALRELRLSADLCSTDRAKAKNPGGRGPLRPRDPGHLAGGRGRCRAAVQGRHDRDSLRSLQAARNHLYARVLPTVGRGGTRLPARA